MTFGVRRLGGRRRFLSREKRIKKEEEDGSPVRQRETNVVACSLGETGDFAKKKLPRNVPQQKTNSNS